MNNKIKSSRRYTKYYSDISKTPAWKALSYGARLLYLELQRQFIETANNNGKIFLSTRDAADRLGASQRQVCTWYGELEHYGFIIQTQSGTLGPHGRAILWHLTDQAHGWLDGKPIKATKDYLKWDGTPFQQSTTKKRKTKTKAFPYMKKTRHPDEKISSLVTKKTRHFPKKPPISAVPGDEKNSSYLEYSISSSTASEPVTVSQGEPSPEPTRPEPTVAQVKPEPAEPEPSAVDGDDMNDNMREQHLAEMLTVLRTYLGNRATSSQWYKQMQIYGGPGWSKPSFKRRLKILKERKLVGIVGNPGADLERAPWGSLFAATEIALGASQQTGSEKVHEFAAMNGAADAAVKAAMELLERLNKGKTAA
jgi:hypothetical protein